MHTEITGHAVDFIDTPSPGDDVGRVSGRRRLRDVTHRLELGRGVVLGDHDHRRRQRQADQTRRPQMHQVDSSGLVATTGPIIQSVMNQKPIADRPPATISPR